MILMMSDDIDDDDIYSWWYYYYSIKYSHYSVVLLWYYYYCVCVLLNGITNMILFINAMIFLISVCVNNLTLSKYYILLLQYY